jgi:adenylate kinase family enzyme
MQRVLVVGITGSGKTRVARELSRLLDLPFFELDGLHFGPQWTTRPTFVADVTRIVETPSWIFDSYGYVQVRELLWARADTVVWLDYPRRVVMPRILRRSVRRTLFREPIFNGNRETVRAWFASDHPARWAWSQFAQRRVDISALCADPRFQQTEVLRFHSPKETRMWLAGLASD